MTIKEVIFVKQKIFLFIGALTDGGAETLVKDYALLLDREKFSPYIFTIYNNTTSANFKRLKNSGIPIISVYKNHNIITRIFNKLFGRFYIPFFAKKLFLKNKPDCLHINSRILHFLNPIASSLSDVKIFYTCHSEPDKYFFENNDLREYNSILKFGNIKLIALHDEMKESLKEMFKTDSVFVIKNGIDLSVFRQEFKTDALREELGINKNAFVMGHIGRFSSVKNHDFLIDVFAEILKRKPNAHLIMIGSGPLKESITAKINTLGIEKNVLILSNRTDIPELLSIMDIFVFPSFFEGLSVTLVEAQASGLPCYISDSLNPQNILSEKTIPISLDSGASAWADIILNGNIKNKNYFDIELYDMKKEILNLEKLYSEN